MKKPRRTKQAKQQSWKSSMLMREKDFYHNLSSKERLRIDSSEDPSNALSLTEEGDRDFPDQVANIIRALEQRIGYTFSNRSHAFEAICHPSYANGGRNKYRSNQRLEFLGDSVLGAVVATMLMHRFKDVQEGDLTAMRSRLVSGANLADVAVKLQLDRFILLGRSETNRGKVGRSIMADLFESLVGAIYLDGGFKAAATFVKDVLWEQASKLEPGDSKDPKTKLQELCQKGRGAMPAYKSVRPMQEGARYAVEAYVGRNLVGVGHGSSRVEAEKAAAEDALKSERV